VNLIEELVKTLKEKSLSLGSVESMTGGSFASAITSVSGSSSVFRGALVTYASELKSKLADVSKNDIDTLGVVSSKVAEEMAIGGSKTLEVDVCVSVTGNAGPSKCEGQADVGDFYIGLFIKGKIYSFFYHINEERNEIRKQAVELMAKVILEKIN